MFLEAAFFVMSLIFMGFWPFPCQMAAYSIFKLAFGPPRFPTSAADGLFEQVQESSFSGL